uniref:Hero resistance protein n=1 Tax=Solanum tuberosum TaxID=4113 RepID=M1CVN6_SOLTU
MDSLVPLLLEEMESYLSLKNDNYVAMTTEEKMFEYLFTNLHDLPNYSSDLILSQMTDYNTLRQVFRRLTDFYPILLANKTTTTQYLFPRFQFIAHTFLQFHFAIWTGNYNPSSKVSEYSSNVTSLLIDIIPLELEVLYISTSKLIKESKSTHQLKRLVKQILKASPKILQNYLIHLQGRMVAVNYSQTQSINAMIEFLLIFLTDIPKRFIHPDKLNDMLAHVGLLTRNLSILMEESSNMNEADFSAPDLLQEIERMKGDIKQNFLKAPDQSSQLCFPMDDGFLFMNLLLRHLNDLLISNAYSVSLIKKEIGIVKQSLEYLTSSFRQTLDDTSGVVKDCWVCALDVAYEAEHVINSILVRDNALSHLLFSLPSVTDKIKLIVAEVTSLQLEDKNGDDPIDAKSSVEPIESTSSSFVEVTVGHEEDEAKMIDQLLDKHESELDVISIVRMPGLGSCPAELSEVGHQIVDKCQGLPLAVVLIAGVIVRGKKMENDLWLNIQDNLDSFISANINLQMMKVMQLSYDHLPYHLKPLLLYFARSRKSKRTPVSKLMQLWMAEGLVNHDIPSKCSLEEATQRYLDALVSSSLIMVDHMLYKKNMPFSVRIKVCYVHDVVHDFCSVKAKKEKFLKLINPGARFHASYFLHHRLTIRTDNNQLHKKCVLFKSKKCSVGSKHLVSLKVSGSLLHSSYICHTRPFGLVRVLQLDSIELNDSLMEEIGSLFHLRFLRIRTRGVKAIPVSWLNLQNLETLLISTGYSTMHLHRIIVEPRYPLTPTHGDWFPKLDVLNKLESLFAKYRMPKEYLFHTESIYQIPHPNEYHFPSSLKELRLNLFHVRPALLSAIAALPHLEILVIIDSDFVEGKWDASEDMYQSLKTLTLRMVNLSEWQVDRETFPKLEELIVEYCEEFTEIPCAFADIDTLKFVHLTNINSQVVDSAMEIKKDVIDFAGEDRLHVHIFHC